MAEKNIVQETFPVLGMSCASCSARVEKTLNHQSGVKKAVKLPAGNGNRGIQTP